MSNLMLLLENMLGSEISSLGGTFGGILVGVELAVPPPLSVGPLKIPGVLSPVEGSIWKGSISLSRASRCFLLLQHANKITMPTATAPPPIEATVIPIIWGRVKVGVGVGVGDIEEATAEYVLAAGVLLDGEPEDVTNAEVVEVLGTLIVYDRFELELTVVVDCGAARTMLGIELCTINVAVMVA